MRCKIEVRFELCRLAYGGGGFARGRFVGSSPLIMIELRATGVVGAFYQLSEHYEDWKASAPLLEGATEAPRGEV